MVTFQTVTVLTPITGAAQFLEAFYSKIAVLAAGPWQALPMRESFNLQEGPFQLVFSCMGDTIPWNFVKGMADRLLEVTRLGVAELFDAIYMDDAGKIAVAVSLRFADPTSSGSSSDTDYREGSVPSVGSPYD